MSSNNYMAAGGAWGALVGMLAFLVLLAAGVIHVRIWEWFLVAIIGCVVAGALGGTLMEGYRKRGR